MIVKCPYCYGRVLPKKDNTCPSCGNNVLDVYEDAEYDLVELKYGQKLPDVCIICGKSTNNKLKIRYSHIYGPKYLFIVKIFTMLILLLTILPIFWFFLSLEHGEGKTYKILIALTVIIIVFFNLLFKTSNPRSAGIKLYLPVCKGCKREEMLKPRYIDYTNSSVTFVAHKNFIDAFHKQ